MPKSRQSWPSAIRRCWISLIRCWISCSIIKTRFSIATTEGEIVFGIGSKPNNGTVEGRNYILDLLRPLGITKKYIGVRQLIQAVEMVMENPDYINVLQKEVLLVITAQYSVSWGAVERNLRSISKKAWDIDSGCIRSIVST